MIGIVGHVARLGMAQALAGTTGAEFVSIDDGTFGAEGNHRRVWRHLAQYGDPWGIVLEDDAVPVPDFRTQALNALAAAPTDIVSFYLGHPEHWSWYPQRRTLLTEAGAEADRVDAHWIVTREILHGVAIAVRTHLIEDMLNHTAQSTLPIDYAIRQWCRDTNRDIAFTWPSLADHADTPTLIKHADGKPRTKARKAWRTGKLGIWTTKAVTA